MAKKVLIVGGDPQVTRIFAARPLFQVISEREDEEPELVVFTGGADINPKLYGEKPLRNTYLHPKRDEKDMRAFEKYKDIPKIGICRGAQFLNVMNGGALWQHVDKHTGEHSAIDVLITKAPVTVTSTHHQMMIPHEDGEVLAIAHEATLYYSDNEEREAPDFDTEVVWYDKTQTLCFQPHPEYRNKGSNPYECRQYFFDLTDYFYF